MSAMKLLPTIFIGGMASVADVRYLGITHVLSVINVTLTAKSSKVKHHQVFLEDEPTANLLKVLPECIDFIDECITSGGKVLVHCQAGVSRSASVAVAYYMMLCGLSLEVALQDLADRCPRCAPNPGFIEQLKLFKAMGCKLDESNPAYKRFCLEQLGQQWEEEGTVDESQMAELPTTSSIVDLQGPLYRCRKCRKLLATSSNTVPVEATAGHKLFAFRRRGPGGSGDPEGDEAAHAEKGEEGGSGGDGGGGGDGSGTSLFVQPMRWMSGAVIGSVSGKLYCPSCNARLGSFSWAGLPSSCGIWVTPAFQLHLSRLDMEAQAGPSGPAIRRPLFGNPDGRPPHRPATLGAPPPVAVTPPLEQQPEDPIQPGGPLGARPGTESGAVEAREVA